MENNLDEQIQEKETVEFNKFIVKIFIGFIESILNFMFIWNNVRIIGIIVFVGILTYIYKTTSDYFSYCYENQEQEF